MKDALDLEKIILGNPLIRAVFSSGLDAYLVGGYIRDTWRGLRPTDIDFAVRGDFSDFLSSFSPRFGGKVVEFRRDGFTRVVIGGVSVDFMPCTGDICDDLSKRDFTMNAVAWTPEIGLIDPLRGTDDIERGVIRAISRANLAADPLRLLRAYRFAGETGWKIDPITRAVIKELRYGLTRVAPERITLEFFKLLNSCGYKRALEQAFSDGVLTGFLSVSSERLRANLKALSRFDGFLNNLPVKNDFRFEKIFSQALSYKSLLRAEIVLHGSDLEKSRLRLSSRIRRRLALTSDLLGEFGRRVSGRENLFDLFMQADGALQDFALITCDGAVVAEASRFEKMKPLLTTKEVMRASGLGEGPELGTRLRELKRLQFLGEVVTRKEAKKWVSGKV